MSQAGTVKRLELSCDSKQRAGSCAARCGAIWSQPWFLSGLVRCQLGSWGASLKSHRSSSILSSSSKLSFPFISCSARYVSVRHCVIGGRP